jgi:Concanavalin A-like lectin/glucanases superfamily
VTYVESAAGSWIHLVATYDGNALRIYRNGTMVGLTITGPMNIPPLDAPLYSGDGFEGLIDQLKIYDRALTPTEVKALHDQSSLSGNG